MRNLGGSFGIALVSTLIVRRAQVHQALMVEHLSPYNPAYVQQLAATAQAFRPESGPVLDQMRAQSAIYGSLLEQASLWAFVENFRLFGIACIACLPLVLLFKKVRRKPGASVGAH
jgi:DHA2 family multidrug resistance protein